MTASRHKYLPFLIGGFLTASVLVGAFSLFLGQKKFGIRLAYDPHDLEVYFRSSRWIVDGGRLYYDVVSEYPLLANIIFAVSRYLGYLIYPGLFGFSCVWIVSSWFLYLYAVYRII